MDHATLVAEVLKFTVIAAGLLIGLGALGTAIGFASSAASSSKVRRASRS